MSARRPPRRHAPVVAVVVGAVVATAVVYLLLVATRWGQRWDLNPLLVLSPQGGVLDDARGFASPAQYGLMAVFAVALLVMAAVRRDLRTPVVLAVALAGSLGTTEVAKAVLGRPQFTWAHEAATFPSGHATVLSGLALGAVVAAPARDRAAWGIAAVAGMAAGAAMLMGGAWHRASDAAAAALVAVAWIAAATVFLSPRPAVPPAPAATRAARVALTVAWVAAVALATRRATADLALMTGAGTGWGDWAVRGVATVAVASAAAVLALVWTLARRPGA